MYVERITLNNSALILVEDPDEINIMAIGITDTHKTYFVDALLSSQTADNCVTASRRSSTQSVHGMSDNENCAPSTHFAFVSGKIVHIS